MTPSPSDPPQLDALIERLGRAGVELATALMRQNQPAALLQAAELVRALAAGSTGDVDQWRALQERYYAGYAELWQRLAASAPGAAANSAPPPEDKLRDRRFRSPEWRAQPYFQYLAEAYLLNARWLADAVEQAALEPKAKARLRFYTRQWVDAMAPANSILTNPEALKLAVETQGESLARGLENLAGDLAKGRLSMTDEAAFEVGRNLAVTPGAVVYENAVMQLLQYVPTTETVHARPLVMVPPCINKYYILDLHPDNSYVRYAVEQGHTVFMVSWKNAKADLAQATWDDYLEQGVLRALEVARDISGAEQVNALGFCIGGTLLGCALGVLAARGDASVASATFLTTMLDFSDTGELDVFVDEAYVQSRERDFAQGGIFRGRDLMTTFSSLRPNDLIWPYVVNNYLKGGKPDAFDLLYWNSDSTNLAGPMYAYYVRNTYLENNLKVPGKLRMCGVPLDLGQVSLPAYVLATREDHIVPWRTAYASTRLLSGPLTFALAASGHIAGVVNPAAKGKRNFWTGAATAALPGSADDWLATAQTHPGSWWPHWIEWLAPYGGDQVPARMALGSARHPVIEAAPGRYVKESCET
jgi:polyhydroxyalkanoate synthase